MTGPEGLNVLLTIWLVIVVSFSLYSLSDYLKPTEGSTRESWKLAVGILGLAFGAMHLRGIYNVVFASLPHSAILFRSVQAIVAGAWTGILLSMGRRRWAKAMLIFAGVLIVGSPLAVAFLLHQAGRRVSLRSVLALPNVYILEIFAVTIAVPAFILLSRPGDSDSEGAVRDDEAGREA